MGDPASEIVPVERRRLARRLALPAVSGKASVAVLVVCFALTAVLIPTALKLPRWVEFELVLAAWWLVWAGSLSLLLYRGARLADDFAQPGSQPSSRPSGPAWFALGDLGWGASLGGDSLVGAILGIVLEIVLAIAISIVVMFFVWLVMEFAIPVLAFGLYFVVRGMLAHVVNDRHRCRGRLVRAVAWGATWATAYTAPLAALVWTVHALLSRAA